MEREWRRAAHAKSWLSVIMADIDFFKAFNDYYGHSKGDECLKLVAMGLNTVAKRPGDFLARYGGEEFALVLPGSDENGAAAAAELMRKAIESLNIVHQFSPVLDRVTISLGAASTIPCLEMSHETLLDTADRMVYAAKAGGRNMAMTTVSPSRGPKSRRSTEIEPARTLTGPQTSSALNSVAGRMGSKQRVLIVDDSPSSISVLVKTLRSDYDLKRPPAEKTL